MLVGNFTAKLPDAPAYLKLEVDDQGNATFVHLYALHTPPAELERITTTVQEDENGHYCLAEQPRSIERCFVRTDEDVIVVTVLPEGTQLSLQRSK